MGTDQVAGLPVLRIEVDRTPSREYGSTARHAEHDSSLGNTAHVGEVREGQRRFPIVVRLAEQYRKDPDAIGQILVLTPVGARLPLARLAHIEKVETPSVVENGPS